MRQVLGLPISSRLCRLLVGLSLSAAAALASRVVGFKVALH